MVRDHLKGIVSAIVLQATNAAPESINSKIQKVNRMACGFRGRERFRDAICFRLGGLDLYPASAMATHASPSGPTGSTTMMGKRGPIGSRVLSSTNDSLSVARRILLW